MILLHFVHCGEQRYWWPLFDYLFSYVCTENPFQKIKREYLPLEQRAGIFT